jgi:hypothetical protein
MIKVILSKAEVHQILSMIDERRRQGWYYDNPEYFNKREQSIVNKLMKNQE